MLKLDLDMFWMLPRTKMLLSNDEGGYCAIGAFNKAAGLFQNYNEIEDLVGSSKMWEIAHMNDHGLDAQGWAKRVSVVRKLQGDVKKCSKFTRRASWPNPERAKRMLLEAVAGKVEIASKELSLESLPSFSEVS